ncbi:MAG: hypothetical protein JWN34_284 [Bryobacterales bacterium]|jgi:hypothetical protein|nr:hypothetical protein [Bryobacterales bacterium]
MFSRTRARMGLIFLALAVAPVAPVSAQTRLGSVSGRVTDANGKPLKGAVVQLENLGSLQIRSYITNSEGRYHFNRLYSEMDYKLTASYNGKRSAVKSLSRFDFKPRITHDLVVE